MSKTKRKLVTFGLSCFCEKARWALDWHDIRYDEISWPPGVHLVLAKRCGAKRTTVPIVLDGDRVIQGSGAIIDWADQLRNHDRTLMEPGALEIERRADNVIGVHVRRLVYSETFPRSARLVKPALLANTSRSLRLLGNMIWPVTRRAIMRKYDITPAAASQSRGKLEAELSWLDDLLADGRTYLAGDRFSRADIAVASFLEVFAQPKETLIYRDMSLPETLLADIQRWRDRPVMRWIIALYQSHRHQGHARPKGVSPDAHDDTNHRFAVRNEHVLS